MIDSIKSGVYQIINAVNGKRYIGSTIDFNRRRNAHFYWLRHGRHYNLYLQNAWNKYGEDAFRFELLESVADKFELPAREQYWINFYDVTNREKGYNIEPDAISHTHSEEMRNKIGNGNRGKFVSLETRQKQSKALLGAKHPMFGKKLPKKWHDNIVKALIGRVVSKKTRDKIRLAHLGKKHKQSLETKKKIMNFIDEFRFRPSKNSKNLVEKRLGKSLLAYINKNQRVYDAHFVIEILKYPTWQEFKRGLN